MMSDSALHRWSNRKTQLKEEKPQTEAESEKVNENQESPSENALREEKKEIELPPIESLDENSDYSVFMSPEVDTAVQKLAMRKLFRLPQFGVLDGLNDYDEDFTTFAGLGDIVTSDMKYHEERKKAEALKKQEESQQETTDTPEEVETLADEQESTDDTSKETGTAKQSDEKLETASEIEDEQDSETERS